MARSTYYYHIAHLPDPDKYEEIKKRIYAIYEHHKGRYGYRRITKELQKTQKTVDSLADSTGKHTASMQQDEIWTRNGTAATDENTASLKENTDEINDNTDAKEKFVLTTEAAQKMQRDYAQSVVDAYDKLKESTKQTLKLSITSEFEGGDDQAACILDNLCIAILQAQRCREQLGKPRIHA